MQPDLMKNFEFLTDLSFNVSNNYLEQKGIAGLLEMVLMKFQKLKKLELDFSDQLLEENYSKKKKDQTHRKKSMINIVKTTSEERALKDKEWRDGMLM